MSDNANECRECRICFEEEKIDDPFIEPCACKGTSKYIHRSCLNTWRTTADNNEAKTRCMECGERYIISRMHPLEINPFKKTIVLNEFVGNSLRNNIFICLFQSVLLCWIDSPNQTSLTILSFGNNWYNYTIGKAIREGDADITIPYYLSLTSFMQNVYIFCFFYYQIYKNIKRRNEFFRYIRYELFFLNLTTINFLVIFWACHTMGNNPYTFFITIIFMMMGTVFNFTIPPALSTVSKSSIKYLNTKKNPETVLNVTNNPLNTVIEMLPANTIMEQKYEELATESDESIESRTSE